MLNNMLQVVKDAIASGVEGYDADARASVRKASQGLRLTKEAAMAIAGKAVCLCINFNPFFSSHLLNS